MSHPATLPALLGLALLALPAGAAPPPPDPAAPAPAPSPLPLGLSWCAKRADVEAAAPGVVELSDDVLEIAGVLEAQKGRFNLMFEDGGLHQVRFRMFDTDAVYNALHAAFTKRFGDPAGDARRPAWTGPDATRILVQRQSGDVFVDFTTDAGRCADPGAGVPAGPTEAELAGGKRDPVYSYDRYSDDPLEDDEEGRKVAERKKAEEEARKKAAEEERKKRENIQIDWGGGGDDEEQESKKKK